MSTKREEVAIAATQKEGVVDYLDAALGPGDQAWLICSFTDCTHMTKGHCDIYTIKNPPQRVQGKPCSRYERRA